MARGYLAGMVTGAIVGGAGIALVSLMNEPANVSEPPVLEESGSSAVQTEPDAAVQDAQPVDAQVSGETDDKEVAQDPVAQISVTPPEEGEAADTAIISAVDEAIATTVGNDAPEEIASEPTQTDPADEVQVESDPVDAVESPEVSLVAPEVVIPEIAEGDVDVRIPGADQAEETPEIPHVAMPELVQPDLPDVVSPAAPELPEAEETVQAEGQIGEEVGSGFGNPVGRLTTRTEGADVSAAGNETILPGQPATPGFDAEGAENADVRGGALERNGVEFDLPGGKSMMSVILLHDGTAESNALLSTLAGVPFPVSIAVSGTHPSAGVDATKVRDAGHEVLVQLALPSGATPADVETGFLSVRNMVPDAVAVLDNQAGQIASDRSVAAQLSAALLESGHGLVLHNAGLNTAGQLASRAGVPNARIFRNLSAGGANAHRIRRMLQRAEFKARQDGAVVLVGTLNDETLTALQEWALDDRGENTVLAPVSAVLLQE